MTYKIEESQHVLIVHTTFNIREHADLEQLISQVEGVEGLPAFGSCKYEFTIQIGKLFRRDLAIRMLEEVMHDYIKNYQ